MCQHFYKWKSPVFFCGRFSFIMLVQQLGIITRFFIIIERPGLLAFILGLFGMFIRQLGGVAPHAGALILFDLFFSRTAFGRIWSHCTSAPGNDPFNGLTAFRAFGNRLVLIALNRLKHFPAMGTAFFAVQGLIFINRHTWSFSFYKRRAAMTCFPRPATAGRITISSARLVRFFLHSPFRMINESKRLNNPLSFTLSLSSVSPWEINVPPSPVTTFVIQKSCDPSDQGMGD